MRRQVWEDYLTWITQLQVVEAGPGFMPLDIRLPLRAEKREKGHTSLRDSRTTPQQS